MGNFHTDVILKDSRANSLVPINDVSLLEPGTRAAIAKMIVLAHEAGHELRVGETYRSQALQHADYLRGVTKLSKVGCHGYGLACDLRLYINGVYDPNGSDYMFFETLCRQARMISGIDWGEHSLGHSFHDWDHVQRVPLFRQPALFDGSWYPAPDYDPWADEAAHGIKI